MAAHCGVLYFGSEGRRSTCTDSALTAWALKMTAKAAAEITLCMLPPGFAQSSDNGRAQARGDAAHRQCHRQKKKPGAGPGFCWKTAKFASPKTSYFRAVVIEPKFVANCVPSALTAAIIAMAIPAAIRPYSMAVAPDSSLMKRETTVIVGAPPKWF